jgi:hypothetical protein
LPQKFASHQQFRLNSAAQRPEKPFARLPFVVGITIGVKSDPIRRLPNAAMPQEQATISTERALIKVQTPAKLRQLEG